MGVGTRAGVGVGWGTGVGVGLEGFSVMKAAALRLVYAPSYEAALGCGSCVLYMPFAVWDWSG